MLFPIVEDNISTRKNAMVEYLDYQIPSRVFRLSDTRYSAEGRWRYASSKATYPWSQYMVNWAV